MKVLIWFGCILVYSAAVAALNLAGVGLGGVPVALLAILLIFLPAPALCRLVDRRRQQRPEAAADPPSPPQERRPFPVEKVRSFLRSRSFRVACFACLLVCSFVTGGFVWREAEGQKVWDIAYIVGQEEGYDDGYAAGVSAGYDDGYILTANRRTWMNSHFIGTTRSLSPWAGRSTTAGAAPMFPAARI